MQKVTGEQAVMSGPSIIGFGAYRLKYANGTEADRPIAGFSPRKQDLTLCIGGGCDHYPDLMQKLGKYRTGKACLYLQRLADVDMKVLR